MNGNYGRYPNRPLYKMGPYHYYGRINYRKQHDHQNSNLQWPRINHVTREQVHRNNAIGAISRETNTFYCNEQIQQPRKQWIQQPEGSRPTKRNADAMNNSSPESGFEDAESPQLSPGVQESLRATWNLPLANHPPYEPVTISRCPSVSQYSNPQQFFGSVETSSAAYALRQSAKAEFTNLYNEYKQLLEPIQAKTRMIVEAGRLLEEEKQSTNDLEVVEYLKREILSAGEEINSKEFAERRKQLNALKSRLDVLKNYLTSNAD